MAASFDQVLADAGLRRANEMVPGYAAYAKAHLDDAPRENRTGSEARTPLRRGRKHGEA
jgi:hypothetical protein